MTVELRAAHMTASASTGPATAAAAATRARRRPRRWRLAWRDVIPPLITAGVVVGGWYAASYLLLDRQRRFLLPPLHAVVRDGFFDAEARSEIVTALLSTAKVAGLGLVLATLIGVGVAIAMSQAKWVERSIYPWAVVLQTIPILAIVPLIGFWWGFDFRSRVLVCVLISVFPMLTNTLFGLRSAAAGLHDLFSLRHASRYERLVKLELPAALPSIFTGLRISGGLAVIGSIVGDFFFRQGDPGIGRLIDNYRAELASEELFAAIIASSFLGVAVFVIVGAINDRTVGGWHESGRRR